MLNIALISDSLTFECLDAESNVHYITPKNYKKILLTSKIDFLFVESTWLGLGNEWRYKVATSPERKVHRLLDFIMQRNTNSLSKVVNFAKEHNIPTVFWNKEDPVHYDRFIASAKIFDYIFTVDAGSISNYQKHTDAIINTLPFAVQSKLHNSNKLPLKTNGRANFVGSYGNPNHVTRKYWQDLMFDKVPSIIPLDIYDRNSDRANAMYRFPKIKNSLVLSKVTNGATADIYKNYVFSLYVNTVETSTTMLSRRLVEIIACGAVAITNGSPAVEKYFKNFCYVVSTEEELLSVLEEIKDGVPQYAIDRAVAGAKYIANNHTWEHRIEQICSVINQGINDEKNQ